MKTAKLNDYFIWEGEITQAVATLTGRVIIFKIKGECPHCGKGVDDWQHVLEDSPNFQNTAQPINTINLE